MRVSQFTRFVTIDKNISILYNALSRRYITLLPESKKSVLEFLEEINKGKYTRREIDIFSEMVRKRIIVSDAEEEIETLRKLEYDASHQEHKFQMVIYTTNKCNFRCIYCTQNHVGKTFEEQTIEQIMKFIEKKTEEVQEMELNWFGGEPLLQYEDIVRILSRVNPMCERNNCACTSNIVTNGFLLNEKKIKNLHKLHVKQMQITVDGNRETHDKQRILINGQGTYDVILKNICMAIEEGIQITLRINIGEKIALDVLDEIPVQYRENVVVSIANIFQNKSKISTYEMAKQVIQKGYRYQGRYNTYAQCIANKKNSLYIDANGSILLCSNTCTDEKPIGRLQSDGQVEYSNLEKRNVQQRVSILQNAKCKGCVELPLCVGRCKYGVTKNDKCEGKRADGLTFEERARLDYYQDKYKKGE